jgi:cyclohexanone monooxygenase
MEEGMAAAMTKRVDAVVVGAGWAGMYMLYRLRELGLSVRLFDAGSGPGGTWCWNRYPGARCDSPSLDNSYSFSEELQQEWVWTEKFAAQPEIERYANHVADRFGLRPQMQFETKVTALQYDEAARTWTVDTDRGDCLRARFCFMATGGYSTRVKPHLPGLDSFAGEMYFTSQWPREPVSFAGKRIGVIGTGSSGVQTVTAIGDEDLFHHLYVFQRTPNFHLPNRNGPLDPQVDRQFKKTYAAYRERARRSGFGIAAEVGTRLTMDHSDEEFLRTMDAAWARGGFHPLVAFPDISSNPLANERVAEYMRNDIRRRVKNPAVAELLCLKGWHVGARRVVQENGYFEHLNKPNVTLVDVKGAPIEAITAYGIRTRAGFYELDMLVLATGFDSGTGAMLQVSCVGAGGKSFAEKWQAGPVSYLGLMAHGFPNLFLLAGPGSPSIRSHVIVSCEQHVEWLADLVRHMRDDDLDTVECTPEAEAEWTKHVADVAATSLMATGDTQYVGFNIPGKPRVYLAYLGGVGTYRQICDRVRDNGYQGLVFRRGDEALCRDRHSVRVANGPTVLHPNAI